MDELRDFLFSIYVMLKFNYPNIIYEEFGDSNSKLNFHIEFRYKSLIRIQFNNDTGKYLVLIYGEPYYHDTISDVKKIISDNLEYIENILIELEGERYDRRSFT